MLSQRNPLGPACLCALIPLVSCSAGSAAGEPPAGAGGVASGGSGPGGSPNVIDLGSGGDPGPIDVGSGGSTTPPMPPPLTNTPVAIDECSPSNPAGIDAAAVQALQAGSGSAGNLRLLNPYDGTVFPRGLIALTIHRIF